MPSARAWGLGGLLVLELSIIALAFDGGASAFTLISALAAAALVGALAAHARGASGALRALFALLAALTLWRAVIQTVPYGFPPANMPSYLVPLGLALLAWRGASWQGVALVAVARTWFVVWYFVLSVETLVLGNLVGAAAAWVWTVGERGAGSATLNDEPRVAPP